MRLLLDTQIALWALTGSQRLGKAAGDLIEDPANEVFVSTATVWEIAIKHALGRGDMPVSGTRAMALFAQPAIVNCWSHGVIPLPLKDCPIFTLIRSIASCSRKRCPSPCDCFPETRW